MVYYKIGQNQKDRIKLYRQVFKSSYDAFLESIYECSDHVLKITDEPGERTNTIRTNEKLKPAYFLEVVAE